MVADTPGRLDGRHLLVTFLVTREGEQGHPMDTITKRVALTDDGTPTAATLARLTESIAREVARKAATETEPDRDSPDA